MKVKPTACPSCSNILRNVTGANGRRTRRPKPGDATVCAQCACLLKFTGSLRLRLMMPEELAALPPILRQHLLKSQSAMQSLRVLRRLTEGKSVEPRE